jgi:hypothetical protein
MAHQLFRFPYARLGAPGRYLGTGSQRSARRGGTPFQKEEPESVPIHYVHAAVTAGLALRVIGRDLAALLRRGAAAGVRVGVDELRRTACQRREGEQ